MFDYNIDCMNDLKKLQIYSENPLSSASTPLYVWRYPKR